MELTITTKVKIKPNSEQIRLLKETIKYTFQTCPRCGHTERSNRNKKKHIFQCRTWGYTWNYDRFGSMNLHRKGIEYLVQELG